MGRFAVVVAAYVAAGVVAWGVVLLAPAGHPLLLTLCADVAATLVVFAVGAAVGNASVYDPYWSVAPPVIVASWMTALTARQVVVLALVVTWSVRLTANWAVSWRGLAHEDWRYTRLRERRPAGLPWWLISLTGIHLVPTLVVFAGLLPLWPAMTMSSRAWDALDVAATVVTAGAVTLETVADRQLRRSARERPGQFADRGLWRHSRHPNYLGEILFWWGLWLFTLSAAPAWWWTAAGPLTVTLLFTTVSVPMMDRRSRERRPGYAEHMAHVPALLPRCGRKAAR